MITPEDDRMSRELRLQIESDYSMTDTTDLFDFRDRTASHYMMYAVKPITGNYTRDKNATSIRAQRERLLKELWLKLDSILSER